MMVELSPIVYFTYKRLDTLRKSINSLLLNSLADQSILYVFSDAAKNDRDAEAVKEVREYIKTITGFKKVIIYESNINKGLANSIISGVTQIINKHGKIIVLEDDLILSSNFLYFMNQCLDYYECNKDVFSISGYTAEIPKSFDDVYFTKRSSSWGWATWDDRWNGLDWDLKNYDVWARKFKNTYEFNKMGSDLSSMLRNQMNGKINSWAIRWCYNQFLLQKYTVYPTISKVNNIGTEIEATHTFDKFNRFATPLDKSNKSVFELISHPHINKFYLKYFLKQFSITTRIKYKLLNKIFS